MRRRTLLGLILPVLLLGAGWAWWATRGGGFRPQSIPLNGGGTLTLVSVQGGRVHVNPFDPPWRQWISRLPQGWAQRLHLPPPASPVSGSGRTNSHLTCWFSYPSNAVTASWPGGPSSLGVWVGDDQGNFAGDDQNTGATGNLRDGRSWGMHRLDIVPRRSEWLRIVVRNSRWSGKPMGEFRVRNPLFDPLTPRFAAQPLPQSVRDGELEFSLQALYLQTNRPVDPAGWSQTAGNGDLVGSARLEFTVRERGQPSTNWVSYHVTTVSDASGNDGDGNSWNHGLKDGMTYVEFSQYPLPGTEPWRMQVEFCQLSGFPTHEVWDLHALGVEPSEAGYETRNITLHGARVTVKSLTLDRMMGGGTDPSGKARVQVVLKLAADKSPDTNRWHLTIVRAVDDQGLDVTANSWSGGDLDREFRFTLSPGARSMDVDLAFAPSRQVWFTAQPKVRGKQGNQ